MKSYASIIICVMLYIALTVTGCSSSPTVADNPISPGPQDVSGVSAPNNRTLWGYWKIKVDPLNFETTVIPVRSVAGHWNTRQWLENGPCFNCVRVLGFENMGGNVFNFHVQVRHPYANPTLTGFDVRGIPIFDSGWEFTGSNLSVPTVESGKGALVNPDGYTRLYAADSEGQGPGGLLGYSKGKFASETAPNAGLNGFMRHISEGAGNTRCALYANDSVVRDYTISMPEAPNPFVFGYAVDSCWASPINKPVDDPMTDFGPEANCPEPWRVEAYSYPMGQGFDSNGSVKILIDVYDHQGQGTHDLPLVECHQLFSGKITAKPMMEYTDFTRYEARIKNTGTGPGTYKCLITVVDEENDWGIWWFPIIAYRIIDLEVIETQVDEGWAATWGDLGYENAIGVECDPWDNVCVVGFFEGTVDLNPGYYKKEVTSNGATDAYLSIFDETGAFQWGLSFGGVGSDMAQGVAVDDEGSVYIAGTFEGTVDFDASVTGVAEATSNGAKDAFLVKYDRLGKFQWVRTWGGTSDDSAGSISWALWYGPPHPSTILVGGSFSNTVKFWAEDPGVTSHGGSDAYMVRFDDDGGTPWRVTWGSDLDEFCSDVTAGMDSCAYAAGDFRNNSDDSGIDFDPGSGTDLHVSGGLADACLVKYNNIGAFVKAVHWGSFSNDIAYGMSEFVDDSDDSIYVTGAYSDAVDFDPGPDEYWFGYVGGADVYLSRFNLDLTHDWTQAWGGTEDDIGYDVDIDINEGPLVTGHFTDQCDFDPGPTNFDGTSNGGKDVFINYFNEAGSFQWARTWGGADDDYAWGVAQCEAQLFYIAGFFIGSNVDFDACGGVDPHSAKGNEDAFLVKYLGDGCW